VEIGEANYVSILSEESPETAVFYEKKVVKEFVVVDLQIHLVVLKHR